MSRQLPLTYLTSYPDDALCTFYDASLNPVCRVPSSEDIPREDFAAFVEWILVINGSSFTVCSEDDLASSNPDPEPSSPSPICAEPKFNSTNGGEPKPTTTDELYPYGVTQPRIAVVREPATMPAPRKRRRAQGMQLFPHLAQGGPQIPILAQRGPLSLRQAQRGPLSPRLAQRGPQIPSPVKR